MVEQIILLVPAILIALTFHEYAHGYVAYRLGDPTAKMAGRLTFNPIPHLDPIGTLMLFLVHFGWAKPVPVDPRYFKDPKRDMLLVAAAGPVMNMILAFISGVLISLIAGGGMVQSPMMTILTQILFYSLMINLALAVFNMLPIPPLDGSKVLRGLLPYRYEHYAIQLERVGPMVLIGLILFGIVTGKSILWAFIGPFVDFFIKLFTFGSFS